MLGAMLGTGPDYLTIPEANFKLKMLRDLSGSTIPDIPAALDRLQADQIFPLWGIVAPQVPSGSYREFVEELVLTFGAANGKPDPKVWIDHTPGNLRYALSLSRLFPEARFVNLIRDGRGVAASSLPLDWTPNTTVDIARWWSTHIAQGLAAAELLGERMTTIRFEDLVGEPEKTLRQLCVFLDLIYDPNMVETRDYDADRFTVTRHHLVKGRPDPSRVDAWKTSFSARRIETFEWATGELLEYLGYPMQYGARARPSSRVTRIVEFAVHLTRRTVLDRMRKP